MEGWVDLGALITPRQGIEPTTAWSKVRHRKYNMVFKSSSYILLTTNCSNSLNNMIVFVRACERTVRVVDVGRLLAMLFDVYVQLVKTFTTHTHIQRYRDKEREINSTASSLTSTTRNSSVRFFTDLCDPLCRSQAMLVRSRCDMWYHFRF